MSLKTQSSMYKAGDSLMIKAGSALRTINMRLKVGQYKNKQAEYVVSH